ncbi:MAG: cache domain-containing protein [Anaerolineae bacterium]
MAHGEEKPPPAVLDMQGEMRIRIVVPVYLNDDEETAEVEEGSGVTVTPLDAGEPKSGRFAGVLIGSLSLDTIAQDFVSPIVSGQTGYAWLLNEEGVFLAHYEQEFVGRSASAVRAERNPEISYAAISFYLAGVSGVGVGPGG